MIGTESKSTINAIGLALKSRKRLAIGIISAIAMAFLSIYIPAAIKLGTTIESQISLLTWENILLITIFSILFGVSIALHSYAMSLKKNHGNMSVTPVGGFAGIIGGVFSGPMCPTCISTIISILGLGSSTAIFMLSHRTEILALSALLIITSIYFVGKKVTRFCDKCK